MGNYELKKTVEVYDLGSETLTTLRVKGRVNILGIGKKGGVVFQGSDGKEYFIDAEEEGGFDAIFCEIKGGSREG